jgi:hypothetical protein
VVELSFSGAGEGGVLEVEEGDNVKVVLELSGDFAPISTPISLSVSTQDGSALGT